MTEAEITALGERAREWVRSPEGIAALTEAMGRAQELRCELQAARRVDWRRLHEPVTI